MKTGYLSRFSANNFFLVRSTVQDITWAMMFRTHRMIMAESIFLQLVIPHVVTFAPYGRCYTTTTVSWKGWMSLGRSSTETWWLPLAMVQRVGLGITVPRVVVTISWDGVPFCTLFDSMKSSLVILYSCIYIFLHSRNRSAQIHGCVVSDWKRRALRVAALEWE